MSLNDKLRIGGVRVGNILFGLCVTSTVLTLFSAFSPLMMAFYLLVMGMLILITLGTIFVFVDGFGSFLDSSTESFAAFTASAGKAMPYFAAVAVLTAAIATVLLLLEVRAKKHTSKIAVAVVCAVLAVIFALLSKAVMK